MCSTLLDKQLACCGGGIAQKRLDAALRRLRMVCDVCHSERRSAKRAIKGEMRIEAIASMILRSRMIGLERGEVEWERLWSR